MTVKQRIYNRKNGNFGRVVSNNGDAEVENSIQNGVIGQMKPAELEECTRKEKKLANNGVQKRKNPKDLQDSTNELPESRGTSKQVNRKFSGDYTAQIRTKTPAKPGRIQNLEADLYRKKHNDKVTNDTAEPPIEPLRDETISDTRCSTPRPGRIRNLEADLYRKNRITKGNSKAVEPLKETLQDVKKFPIASHGTIRNSVSVVDKKQTRKSKFAEKQSGQTQQKGVPLEENPVQSAIRSHDFRPVVQKGTRPSSVFGHQLLPRSIRECPPLKNKRNGTVESTGQTRRSRPLSSDHSSSNNAVSQIPDRTQDVDNPNEKLVFYGVSLRVFDENSPRSRRARSLTRETRRFHVDKPPPPKEWPQCKVDESLFITRRKRGFSEVLEKIKRTEEESNASKTLKKLDSPGKSRNGNFFARDATKFVDGINWFCLEFQERKMEEKPKEIVKKTTITPVVDDDQRSKIGVNNGQSKEVKKVLLDTKNSNDSQSPRPTYKITTKKIEINTPSRVKRVVRTKVSNAKWSRRSSYELIISNAKIEDTKQGENFEL
ncbi:unnamed protein product [Bursaphelenchus xylophilus]|uniref:(pine wood nematode) hypothetical protein n=1 Tax=Bursaphelenchus xylophilus TaxID=6326 RepID=A0A1I7RIH2_BURXY|nr:unnamed protein product [Bursaphelenchus xylophilus]CAG9080762.1 unnamed protein product [Bursaphelenchus xylophilus]